MTYISTALSVIYNECKIILCDINLEDGLINLDKLQKIITPKTKCNSCKFQWQLYLKLEIKKILPKRIKIIYDASQSQGCLDYNKIKNKNINYTVGVKANNDALMSCYSLYPGKNLGALGDAGVITTNNLNIYKKLVTMRNIGSSKNLFMISLGIITD